jgi:hypothetical protein
MSTPRSSVLLSVLAPLALAAAPVGLLVLATTPQAAHAQDAFSAPIVELLPVGQVVADGATPVTFQVLALDAAGAPIMGMDARIALSDKQGVRLTQAAPGIYTGQWTPQSVNTAGQVQVTLKGKAGRESITKSWSIPVTPAAAGPITATANPAQLTLGQDVSASLTFMLSGAAASAAQAGDLAVLSSSGDVANLTSMGNGTFTAMYTPPAQAYPQLAVITLVDRRNPSTSYGSLVLSLVGKAAFPVTGMPGSRVMVRVGAREYGPVAADAAGRAQVPIVVPPGVGNATVVSILGDKKSESPLNLQVPPSKRVRLFPTLQTIPADPTASVTVRAKVATPEGAADTAAQISFTATGGTVGAAVHEGNGIYKAMFTPAPSATAAQATISVSVADAQLPQNDALTINLAPARPASLALAPEPAMLPAGAMAFQVLGKVTGTNGAGVSGQRVDIQAEGARLNGQVRDLGGGDYQAAFSPREGNQAIPVNGAVKLPATGNPLNRLVVVADSERLPSSGGATTGLTVVALDAYGYPVANVPVNLTILQGGGVLAPTTMTDANGMARMTYTAGDGSGLSTIQATSGDKVAGVAILKAPGTVAQGMDLPAAGTDSQRRMTDAWDALITSASVNRQGSGMAVRPTPATPSVATRLEMAAEPSSAVAGGSVVLRISARDARGVGLTGQALTVQTTAGQVGPVQDTGGGSYQTTLLVPAGTTGGVQVVVSTAGGGVAAFLDLPIGAGSTAAWGVGDGQADTAKPAKAEKPPREAREQGDHTWLRLSGGYLGGLYSYQQSPATQQGPLYAREITVGGGSTDPAGTTGVQLNGRMFLPAFDYIGFEAGFRSSNWSIQLAEGFDEPIPDWLNEFSGRVIGRYPIDFDGGRVHFGARAGVDVNDFLYFTQEDADDGSVDLLYQQLIVPGTMLGAEVGAEVGNFFTVAAYEAGFTDFDGAYSQNLDLDIGVSITEMFFIQGDLGWNSRTTTVYAGDDKANVGSMRDSMSMFGLQAGFQLR